MKPSVSVHFGLLVICLGARGLAWDVEPFHPPIGCRATYRCPGDEYDRGRVTSRNRHWSKADCLADLHEQVTGWCVGKTLLSQVTYTDHSGGGTSPGTTVCPEKGLYYPWAAVSGANGGFGSANGSTRADAEARALRGCRSVTTGCRTASAKNGCVAYVFEVVSRRSYFGTGCTKRAAESSALSRCPGVCETRTVYCARY